MRLKEKLGDRANASSEVEYSNAVGYMVGEPGAVALQTLSPRHCACMTTMCALRHEWLCFLSRARHRKYLEHGGSHTIGLRSGQCGTDEAIGALVHRVAAPFWSPCVVLCGWLSKCVCEWVWLRFDTLSVLPPHCNVLSLWGRTTIPSARFATPFTTLAVAPRLATCWQTNPLC